MLLCTWRPLLSPSVRTYLASPKGMQIQHLRCARTWLTFFPEGDVLRVRASRRGRKHNTYKSSSKAPLWTCNTFVPHKSSSKVELWTCFPFGMRVRATRPLLTNLRFVRKKVRARFVRVVFASPSRARTWRSKYNTFGVARTRIPSVARTCTKIEDLCGTVRTKGVVFASPSTCTRRGRAQAFRKICFKR